MQAATDPPTPAPSPVRPGDSRLWYVLFLAMLLWQGWLTLTLFGTDRPWRGVLNEQPLLSGRHPLHLYHGLLGARAFTSQGSLSCYDPAFQAGYPKTPVFDSGSRPAELFFVLSGGRRPALVYKLGLALCSALMPAAIWLAVVSLNLSRRTTVVTTFLALLVWWGRPCQALLASGDLDLLLAALAMVAQCGLLMRFHRQPGFWVWLGLLCTGFLSWFAQPLFSVLLLPLFLLYYIRVGSRHVFLWHLALLGGLLVALAMNVFWLRDWIQYWWLRLPLQASETLLPHRTPRTVWQSELWGEPLDRVVLLGLLGLGSIGGLLFNQRGDRATARLFGLGALGLLLLALGGLVSDLLGRLNAGLLLVPALLLTVPLAGHALEQGWVLLVRRTGTSWRAALVVLVPSLTLGWFLRDDWSGLSQRARSATPLLLGFDDNERDLIEHLRASTTAEARILWEDRGSQTTESRWTVLLPWLTERAFLGGLDPRGTIEHTAGGLVDQMLGGRGIEEWTDTELEDYCQRYNIGWVVCWSPRTIQRFARWKKAERCGPLTPTQNVQLFALKRPLSFVLRGKAVLQQADPAHICLRDVIPDNGVVVLSMHYQEGLVASPSRVHVERELDTKDLIPLIRLRVDRPVARVTLTWDR